MDARTRCSLHIVFTPARLDASGEEPGDAKGGVVRSRLQKYEPVTGCDMF